MRFIKLSLLVVGILFCIATARISVLCADGTYHQQGFCPANLTSPGSTNVASSTADGTITVDRADGTIYGCVTTSATPLTSAQIIACSGGTAVDGDNAVVSSAGQKTLSFTGLSSSTTYYVQYAHRFNLWDSNVQVSASFTTAAGGGGGQDIVSETSECYDRIITGGQSCADDDILCVGAGQEYNTTTLGIKTALQNAIDATSAGDAICIRGGTYTHTPNNNLVTIGSSKNCTSGAGRCFISGYPNEDAIIEGSGSAAAWDDLYPLADDDQTMLVMNAEYWDVGFIEWRYSSDHVFVVNADNLRIHHNYVHNSWHMAFRIGDAGVDDDGEWAGANYAATSVVDVNNITIDRNYIHNTRTFGSIIMTRAGGTTQVYDVTVAYNVIHSNGFEPDGDSQGGVDQGDADGIQAFKDCYAGGDEPTGDEVRCGNFTIKHNIVWNTSDDCYDFSLERLDFIGNIGFSCGLASGGGRRIMKDFLRSTGLRNYWGNLLVGNVPSDASTFRGTEWSMYLDFGLFAYNNTEVGMDNDGYRFAFFGEPSTAANFKVKNSLGMWSGTEFSYALNAASRDTSNNWDEDSDGVANLEVGTVEASSTFSVNTSWAAGSTMEEIHRHMWLQFYNSFKPAAGSGLIDAGIQISGVHCASADAQYPYPLSTGYDDTCVHWTGSNPDIGAFDR